MGWFKRRGLAWILGGIVAVAPATVPAQEVEYRIGVDDVLAVSVWDNKDLSEVTFVRPDGKISLPLIGEIQAAGRTVADLEKIIQDAFEKVVKVPRVTILVREIRSRPIFFIGGVARPGPMQLTQELGLLQAISLAGGLTEGADHEAAFVLRGEKTMSVNLVKLIQKADLTQNLKLKPGDTIVVPVADVVYIQGEVRTPRAVKYTRNLTILNAIAQAGGFTELAAQGRVNLVRGEGLQREHVKLDVGDMMKGEIRDLPLNANDIVIVPQRLF